MNSAQSFVLPFPLNRPEYVAVPEAFISSLANSWFRADSLYEGASLPVGLYFDGPKPSSRSLHLVGTRPAGKDLASFVAALDSNGIRAESNSLLLGEAVLNSIFGIKVERSQIHPASPLTPSIAALQNIRGLLRKGNPADIAKILETMYAFGRSTDGPKTGAAERWNEANEHRLEIDPLLRALDAAIDSSILKGKSKIAAPSHGEHELFAGRFANTPFEWFAEAWDCITAPEWVEALPARVWVDWATTILRLAYGFGFLWEATWYVAFARDLQRPVASTWDQLKDDLGDVIPWVSSRAGTAARDVAPRLISRIHQGERVRRLLNDFNADHPDAVDFDAQRTRMRADSAFRDSMRVAISSNGRESSGNNLWEATKYALLARGTSQETPDYYGVLQASGRFLTVSPGTEWVAVVASLACGKPGGITDVGTVLDSLERLGMRPELGDLVTLLERAGMARGSADADRGVLVESAF